MRDTSNLARVVTFSINTLAVGLKTEFRNFGSLHFNVKFHVNYIINNHLLWKLFEVWYLIFEV